MIYLKITQAICIYFIMTETNDEQPNALIGRGESVIRPAEPTDVEADDAEQVMKNEETEIEGIKESQGWIFPKVKLSAWDPENEKQWEATGKYIAKRNLLASIPNLTCGFGVWLVWSGESLVVIYIWLDLLW